MTLLHVLGIFLLLCLITVDGKLKEGECEGEKLVAYIIR